MSTKTTLGPGIHRDVSMATYLSLPFMSASRLEALRRSPRWYRHQLTAPQKTSDALERGTALHLFMLEPALYESEYVIAEPCRVPLKTGDRKGEKCGKPGLFQLRDMGWACGTHVKGFGSSIETGGPEAISPELDAQVRGMAAAIKEHGRARTLFEGRGEFEVTIVFEDPETGVMVRIRPDRLIERAGMYVALKTTRDATEYAFPADAERRGYFRSLALYRRGLRAAGWPYSTTAVLAVESEPPYDPVPYLVEESDLDSADAEITRLLRRFKDCEADNCWPGHASEFLMLRRPRWATNNEEHV
jgi:hypothetical protein